MSCALTGSKTYLDDEMTFPAPDASAFALMTLAPQSMLAKFFFMTLDVAEAAGGDCSPLTSAELSAGLSLVFTC